MFKIFRLIVPILFIPFYCCNEEPVDPIIANQEDVILKDSELYGLLQRVALNEDGGPGITCIDFVYPFNIFTYDEALMFLDAQEVSNDSAFSEFLGNLEPGYSISLSLPITTLLDGGLSLSIDSYVELREAIDNCMNEDFLAYCIATITDQNEECVWDITSVGQYQGSYFSMNPNGSVIFYYNGQEYLGTWIMLIIEEEVHLNINLEGNSAVATDWNLDWLVTIAQDNLFEINNGLNTVVLERDCNDGCGDLVFQSCETIPGGSTADFELTSYEACILAQANIQDPATVTVTFHETQIDAESNTNAISGIYTNLVSPQTIYVRIEDNISGDATLISITIEAITC